MPSSVIIILFIVIIFLLFCSAFFSSAETAFTTASVIRLKTMADDKVRGARKAVYIAENTDKTLIAILIGNNFVNICSTTLCAFVFGILITNPTLSNILNTVIMTLIVLIFGEIVPKTLASRSPEKLALRYAGFMYVYMKILTPLIFIFLKLQNVFARKSNNEHNPTITENELESIIDKMEEEGVIESEDADLIQGVLDIQEKTAYDIMTPRVDIVAVDTETLKLSPNEIFEVFNTSNYSRLPVYDEDKDHIIGIINYKDFCFNYINNKDFDVTSIVHPALFVNKNMRVNDVLRLMQKEKQHLCIVVDEHGGTSGLVTFEDTIEEVVGEVYDEHDDEEDIKVYINKIDENVYELSGDTDIKNLFDYLEIEHLPDTNSSQVAGLLYDQIETMPEVDQKVTIYAIDDRFLADGTFEERVIELDFTILEVENGRIERVRLETKLANKSDEQKEE